MNLPIALIASVDSVNEMYAGVRPDAPAVPEIERPRRTRTIRASLARGLTRAARVIAPA